MSAESFPERLYEAGFRDLVSVIPPGAKLMPSSTISPASVGKIPGRRHASGLWHGYNWRADAPVFDDVRRWVVEGANVGLRADHWPAVDIDCTDPALAKMIEEVALGQLGPAPIRIGRAPKRLLMYRTSEPFGRMRLILRKGSESHLVEILGRGQQYLVSGTHPSGSAYEWLSDPTAAQLTTITRDDAERFLAYLAGVLEMFGTVERIGDGRKTSTSAAADQQLLKAPSLDALREAVAVIPNDDALFPGRDEYIRMGYAIKAAAGDEHQDDGYEIFAGWAAKHAADGRVAGNPETWLSDWRRLNPPYSVGWSFIAEIARGFGFNDAELDFDAVQPAPERPDNPPPQYSDQDLADKIVEKYRGVLRYLPERGAWMVYTSTRWVIDSGLQAEDLVLRGLRDIAARVMREGVTPKEQKESLKVATSIASARKASDVARIVKANRSIAVTLASLDHDPMLLNTPGGIVDLETGEVSVCKPDALCSKSTIVPPDFTGAAPEWRRFLAEATGGDRALEAYLQRLAGYALTGSTREQHLSFIFGPGGNGKSVFLTQLAGILGDYAKVASMDTFTAAASDKHTTDIAGLVGARLVTASESTSGKRWDDQRIKSLTGGEPVTARFMRQDNFTFTPQFKLIFIGNHQPEIRDVDDAMRRRIHMVPFTVKPARVDRDLSAKLREEWPAILAWAIEGCLAWQRDGLNPPALVTQATEEYFENEDVYGKWIKEQIVFEPDATVTTQELFQSWQEWAHPQKAFVGSLKRLSAALAARGWTKWQDPRTRRVGYVGVRLHQEEGGVKLLA